MAEKTVEVKMKTGLQARQAALIRTRGKSLYSGCVFEKRGTASECEKHHGRHESRNRTWYDRYIDCGRRRRRTGIGRTFNTC